MAEARSGARIGGVFDVECWRWHDENGKRFRDARGRFERRLVWREHAHNIITNEGLDHILNVVLDAATQITTWYCALVESNTDPAAGMTYATPTFTECTAYTEGTRPEYEEAASSSQSVTNSANKASFSVNATKTLYGAAVVGGGSAPSTKGNTEGGGTLLCYAKFTSARGAENGDTLNLTYTIGAADDAA